MAVTKEAEEVIVEDAFTEDDCPKCPPQGAPAWMSTFADMATLLMAFFVLILFKIKFSSIGFKVGKLISLILYPLRLRVFTW